MKTRSCPSSEPWRWLPKKLTSERAAARFWGMSANDGDSAISTVCPPTT
jgi:hypothetical protein